MIHIREPKKRFKTSHADEEQLDKIASFIQSTISLSSVTGMIPEHGFTGGASNCYWDVESQRIIFGPTAYSGAKCMCNFHLPSNYVAGTDLTFYILWFIAAAGPTADYLLNSFYNRDGITPTSVTSTSGQWTGNSPASSNLDSITLTGTNLLAGDVIQVEFSIDDNSATNSTLVYAAWIDFSI